MPIVSSSITKNKGRKNGGVKVDLTYVLGDAREFIYRQISFPNMGAANQALSGKEDEVYLDIQNQDASKAVELSISTAYLEATLTQVQFAHLNEGCQIVDTSKSYSIMKEVADDVLGLGLTVEEMATLFNVPEEDAQHVLDRWNYFDLNSATLDAYQVIYDGDPR